MLKLIRRFGRTPTFPVRLRFVCAGSLRLGAPQFKTQGGEAGTPEKLSESGFRSGWRAPRVWFGHPVLSMAILVLAGINVSMCVSSVFRSFLVIPSRPCTVPRRSRTAACGAQTDYAVLVRGADLYFLAFRPHSVFSPFRPHCISSAIHFLAFRPLPARAACSCTSPAFNLIRISFCVQFIVICTLRPHCI